MSLRRRGSFGNKAQLKVVDDFINDRRIFDEGDDLHTAVAFGADKGVNLINVDVVILIRHPAAFISSIKVQIRETRMIDML